MILVNVTNHIIRGGEKVKIKSIFADSILGKIILIGILIFILLIPTIMVGALVEERENRREEVIEDITEKWGEEQKVGGPILTIPYKETITHGEEKEVYRRYFHMLPDTLEISGTIHPEIRYRSIYETLVYNSNHSFEGKFPEINLEEKELELFSENTVDISWGDPFIVIGISDVVGINDKIDVAWNGELYNTSPGTRGVSVFNSGVSTEVQLLTEAENKFNFEIDLKGSHGLKFYPLGKTSNIDLNSDWKDPSFQGRFLPIERTINENGFSAYWEVFDLNKGYPQQWQEGASSRIRYAVEDSALGVNLLLPVDSYRNTERAIKYAVMFILLTFLVYFFIEILKKINIHPVQYLLVGISLVLFYLLLLALSEHIAFHYSYLIASISTILLISLYTAGILKEKITGILAGGILVVLYSFLYILLELQDYSLLLGSIGIFIIMAVIMYLSRNVDWYALNDKKDN